MASKPEEEKQLAQPAQEVEEAQNEAIEQALNDDFAQSVPPIPDEPVGGNFGTQELTN